MTNEEFLTIAKETIKARKEYYNLKKIVVGEYIQLNDKGWLKQEIVKSINGTEIHLKGFQKPFTLVGDKLIRGKQTITVRFEKM